MYLTAASSLPDGGTLYQSDATSWMGMYCLNMLTIALELAKENDVYEDMASKFFEHFLYISSAINYQIGDKCHCGMKRMVFIMICFSYQAGIIIA